MHSLGTGESEVNRPKWVIVGSGWVFDGQTSTTFKRGSEICVQVAKVALVFYNIKSCSSCANLQTSQNITPPSKV